MEPTSNVPPAAGSIGRCPYLGLHDDAATSLAYPSDWNYCYRAKPPSSVLNSYQAEACLGAGHGRCPVFLRAEAGPMLSNLRGDNTVPVKSYRASTKTAWVFPFIVIVIIIAALAYFAPRYVPWEQIFPTPSSTPIPVTSTHRATVTPTILATDPNAEIVALFTSDAQTRVAAYTPTPTALSGTPPSPTRTPTSTITPSKTPTKTSTATSTRTRTPTKTPTVTAPPSLTPTRTVGPTQTPGHPSTTSLTPVRTASALPTSSTANRVCGHSLDTPFGKDTKFVIHRVLSGENLTVYATTYKTTTDAILAINYHLPLPVWADWIIVIPVGLTDMSGIPPFEPYQAVGASVPLEALAGQLNTDLQALRKYNDFEEPCTMFSGWLLVPRPDASP